MSWLQSRAKEARITIADAAASEATITRLRPKTSEIVPATNNVKASVPVVAESSRLLVAGERENSRAKVGRSGWAL